MTGSCSALGRRSSGRLRTVSVTSSRAQSSSEFQAIGTLQFPEAGPQLLTFHYGKGNNFAYFEFESVEAVPVTKP